MSVAGKLDVKVKVNQVPSASSVENGWQQFEIDCDGKVVRTTVKLKAWKKLLQASENYTRWIAVIAGKMGDRISNKGFILENPVIQVFENKAKSKVESVIAASSRSVAGRLELTIKINELPPTRTVKHERLRFEIDCDGRTIRVTLRPRVWKKLQQAQENYPVWTAVITGQMGNPIPKGFILENPVIQVFEKKPKPLERTCIITPDAQTLYTAASRVPFDTTHSKRC